MSLLLITATAAVLYRTLQILAEARTARIALLPLLALLGLGNLGWSMQYCSEHWINLLVASMLYCLVRLFRRIGRDGVNLAGLGLSFGLMPLVKWQGVPMAALAAACAAAIVTQRCVRERAGPAGWIGALLPLAALGLAPLLGWCLILWLHGSLEYFLQTYVVALFGQATSRFSTTLAQRVMDLPGWSLRSGSNERWFVLSTSLFWIPAAALVCLRRRPRRFPLELALAGLYFATSVYAVIQPGGTFLHYLNLLLLPYAVLSMLAFLWVTSGTARPALALSGYLVLGLLLPGIVYLRGNSLILMTQQFQPLTDAHPIDVLRSLHVAGSPMIQWGWLYEYYVDTVMTWGTRTGGSHERSWSPSSPTSDPT